MFRSNARYTGNDALLLALNVLNHHRTLSMKMASLQMCSKYKNQKQSDCCRHKKRCWCFARLHAPTFLWREKALLQLLQSSSQPTFRSPGGNTDSSIPALLLLSVITCCLPNRPPLFSTLLPLYSPGQALMRPLFPPSHAQLFILPLHRCDAFFKESVTKSN